MAMTLTVPDDLEKAANELADQCGASPESILLSAIRNQLLEIPSELREEMAMWELASETDVARVEREYGL
jgi:predicted transcriptional regulator